MKPYFTFLIALLISMSSFAQQGINYKAVIKDALGNVVAFQTIDVHFSILQGTTDAYRELHTETTDANGIIILNIGEGSPSLGIFNDLDWASDDHFLKVEVDIERDGTFVFIGTNQFKTVPYALNAANVSGIEKIIENAKTGWRLKDQNAANYGDIGAFAVDLSMSLNPSSTLGATGNFSTALGGDTTASGDLAFASGNLTRAIGISATAIGKETLAQGDFSTATGLLSKAIGNTSFAMGFNTTANGFDAVSMGYNTKADAHASLAIGRHNIGGGNTTGWLATDPLFEIGNGTSTSNKSNALTVLKNGTITAPSLTNTLIDNAGNKALVTKEYVAEQLSLNNDRVAVKLSMNGVLESLIAFTDVPINFNFAYYNFGGGTFNDTNGSYIIPSNGVYAFNIILSGNFSTQGSIYIGSKIYVNGNFVNQIAKQFSHDFSTSYGQNFTFNHEAYLNAGDVVTYKVFGVFNDTGTAPTIGGTNTTFAIHKVY